MKCNHCAFDNPAGMRFCGGCGNALPAVCAACNAENPAGHRFCGACGAALGASTGTEIRPPAPNVSSPDAADRSELRQVTVLFCDLVGSTRLSGQLDPETYRLVMASFRELCVGAVHRMGGEVARYLGDGLLIVFGWPIAWEDDVRRAVRTALAIRDSLPGLELPADLPRGALQVRIGIHTGLVVVGDLSVGGRTEHDGLFGETPNIAARIQGEAEPDTILLSGTTASLVAPFFELDRRGHRELRGVGAPVEIVEVVRESDVRDRMATVDPASPVFGRDREMSLLFDRWARARGGNGDSVLLLGEPGIGKSRLAAEVRRFVASDPGARVLAVGCSAYETASPLRPFVEVLQHDLGLVVGTLSETNAASFAEMLGRRGLAGIRVAALASLFGAAGLFSPDWDRLSPERKRGEIFEAFLAWMMGAETPLPLLLLVEDVHWADESTLALLGHLLERGGDVPLFILMTGRPEFHAPWPARLRVTQIALQRLGADEGRRLIESAAGEGVLSAADIERIIARADGVPLFIEELVRELHAREPSNDKGSPIPATLRDLLMARIDRARDARPLLEIGALLGKSFEFSLLAAVARRPEAEVERQLSVAADAGFIEVRGVPPLARLGFRHALIQEAVYQSTLRQRRSELHGRIATVLRSTFPELVDSQPEIYAAHCADGGMVREAVDAWQRAGRLAVQRSAHAEAARHYGEAVSALSRLPDDPARDELELGVQVALGAQMIAARGNGAPEVEAAYRRAEALCERVHSSSHRFRALRGLLTFFMVRGRPAEAERIGGQLLELAGRSADPGILLQVHRPLGLNLFYLGRFAESLDQLNRALLLHDPVAHASHRHEFGSDPAVLAMCNRGWVRWFVGELDGALSDCADAVARARALEHPHSLAFALSFLASVRQGRREPGDARAVCEELDELAGSNAFPYWATWSKVLGGWATAELGRTAAGVSTIAAGLTAYRATGAELMVPYFAALLGEARLRDGNREGARAMLDEGLVVAREHSISFYAPELLRLLGRIDGEAGANSRREAIEWSSRTGAVTLGLRALTDCVAAGEADAIRLRPLRTVMRGESRLADLADADACMRLAATDR
jgi:class 3 adenylate cyclase/predicted ATPase